MNYFVYTSAGHHLWRFVYFAKDATDGDDAIRQAWREAVEMGETPQGDYMACAWEHIYTATAEPVAVASEGKDEGDA